jgi:hypothetical protein
MTRPLYPRRDPVRESWLMVAGRGVAAFILIGAVCIAPSAIVSTVTGGWG